MSTNIQTGTMKPSFDMLVVVNDAALACDGAWNELLLGFYLHDVGKCLRDRRCLRII
ncbi:MAG: hypothetical protein O3C28_03450 [Proteobacteria bacterium]|nr:hypothetical protein [Pseudomonadota bacterium]